MITQTARKGAGGTRKDAGAGAVGKGRNDKCRFRSSLTASLLPTAPASCSFFPEGITA